uniref:Nuclear receptor coactivator 6 TRADD-N domain-containing protein n=1 Tax=Ciona savignyi TaxID=51511 RepID=H2Z875_CIOSA
MMNVELIYDGDFNDKNLPKAVDDLKSRLSKVIGSSCVVKKVEPWNSVKVTFTIPRDAAAKLKELAASNSNELNELGVLSVQVEGEEIIKLSFDNGDGHPQQVIIHQQPVISTDSALHKASVHAMFNTGPQYNGANSGQVTPPQPATNTPAKKR